MKLDALLTARGIDNRELAAILEVDRSMPLRWRMQRRAGRGGGSLPSAVYFGWILQVLGTVPEELVGRPPGLAAYAAQLDRDAEALRKRAQAVRAATTRGTSADDIAREDRAEQAAQARRQGREAPRRDRKGA